MATTKPKSKTKSNGQNTKLKFDTGWEYAPAPESKSAYQTKGQYDLFINGELEKPSIRKIF